MNTVNSFSDKTLPVIIPSLLQAGIEKSDIYIFEGGHEERSVNDYNGIVYIKTNHNSLEYTSFIEIVENKLISDYWFYIHDTSVVGSKFKELLYNIPANSPEKIALTNYPSMSMGSYSYDYILSKKDLLLSIKNSDYSKESILKWKSWGVENEDFILFRNNDLDTPVYNPELVNRLVSESENIYGGESERIKEYYPQLDLYKYKSNWMGLAVELKVNV